MSRTPDTIAIVERAYDVSVSDEAWLEGVHVALKPLLDHGLGVSISTWTVDGSRFGNKALLRGDLHPGL